MSKMCGRYFLNLEDPTLQPWLDMVHEPFAYKEVFPSNQALVLEYDTKLVASIRSWGFLKWDSTKRIINARSESITTSPFFKDAYASKRAIVVASGFYEWDHSKMRHQFTPKEGSLLYLAGLIQKETGHFAIITQPAKDPVSSIHTRQPVSLAKENIEDYCNHTLNVSLLQYNSVALNEHALIQQATLF